MRGFTKRCSVLIALVAYASSSSAIPESSSVARRESVSPLLTAGALRIESERSYKLGLQAALEDPTTRSKAILDRSIGKVDRLRRELGGVSDKSDQTVAALKRANRALADQMKDLPKLTAANAASMYEINENLLNKLNALSSSLESDATEESSRVVALAMRQASLAQRMAKIVFLRSLDSSTKEKVGLRVDLAQSKLEFVNGMKLLEAESASNVMLKNAVALAKQQWMFYESALTSDSKNTVELKNIASTSDRITQQMMEIVNMKYGLPPDSMILSSQIQ